MAKVANVKLVWNRSPSPDDKIGRVEIAYTINGAETLFEIGKEVQEFMVRVAANSAISYRIKTYDNDTDAVVTSEIATMSLGDLELPLPASNLGFEVVSVEDVDEE